MVAGFARNARREHALPGLQQDPLREARLAVARGQGAGVIGDMRTAVLLNPGDWSLRLDAAEQLRQAGDLSGSLRISRQAVAQRPDSAEAHVAVGLTLLRQRALEEAYAEFDVAARLSPRSARAHAGLGEVLLDQDRYPAAAAEFSRALALAPDDAGVHNSLGISLALAGEPEKAIPHFARAVELAPSESFRANLERAEAASRRRQP